MKFAIVSIALLVGSSLASAQTSTVAPFKDSGCPVSMKLSQAIGSGLMLTAKGHSGNASEAKLLLVLSRNPRLNAFPANIQSADVTVYGYTSSKPRFELVQPSNAPIAQSAFVRFTSASGTSAYSEFAAPGLKSVTSLEINLLTFSNGRSWRPAAGETCTVVPGALQLIK